MAGQKTNVPMTKQNKLGLLRRAREIISNPRNWTTGDLRRKNDEADDGYSYCVLGALEKAAYDLGLSDRGYRAFSGDQLASFTGYKLGEDLSLYDYSREIYADPPFRVNDRQGYEATLKLLDDYINVVQLQEE